MIGIKKKNVQGIPVLEVGKLSLEKQALPTVFFIHGFTSAKEHNLHYAYLLAEKNFRAILPEANLHGERSQSISENERNTQFWSIVVQTIEELNILKDTYVEEGLTVPDKIGLAGLSMGGIITLGALSRYQWIKVAVSLMGSPSYDKFSQDLIHQYEKQGEKLPFTNEQVEEEMKKIEKYDLSKRPETLQGRPLLFWHGKMDKVVPYQYAWEFYHKVKDEYGNHPEKIQFILDEKAEHKVTRAGVLKTVEWFEMYLA
ncbi:prolyl oligopeptidase family serine peptidase [Fervidibacillus halotolerans]|uniref:Prolyl oligopeptidase family serine peptidase n=1 Tax=Fervidibacillus halotolerans TaxID=2980027 RepID=A0A9E8M1A8_9BACI|nr:prolyl oligopeptidase family serine peptidase [Fervidibacillus halotolerans]WAA13055.1 prolyl oligopeptidase family serine peptidase [Fervidibacillus halotolerans]